MRALSTAPLSYDFDTSPSFEHDTESRNLKVSGLMCARNLKYTDSSVDSSWQTIEEDLSCSSLKSFFKKLLFRFGNPSYDTTLEDHTKYINDVWSAYEIGDSTNNLLELNDYFDPKSKPHALSEIGNELFKEARPRNAVESKIINDFIRSKSNLISSKKL